MRNGSMAVLVALAAVLGGCGDSGAPAPPSGTTGSAPAGGDASARVLKAENVLPPGQSGFFSLAGQAEGLLTGQPGDYGAHVDDQRLPYWSFAAKPGALGSTPGVAVTPLAGVSIWRDGFGVPIVHAGNVHDLWFGVGYAVAQDRLFLMDAVRRMGQGTMGELTGCGAVPGDIQQRTLTYTDAEYQGFYDALSADARDAVNGYVDGANAWRAHVLTTPTDLPAEYALLTTTPAAFTTRDVLAAGVFITRYVAAEGGKEFQNIRMLKLLQARYGTRAEALKAFQDLVWLEDPKAVVTVPRDLGSFSNQPEPAAGREAVLAAMADEALKLPETLWKGDGTGAAAAPQPCKLLSQLPLATTPAQGSAREVIEPRAQTPGPDTRGAALVPSPAAQRSFASGRAKRREASLTRLQAHRAAMDSVLRALADLRTYFHGGSHAFALAPSRTRDGGTLLLSGPQLGYSYPTLLVEYEIAGAGYAARGVSVPLLPVVGIGYSDDVAWGLTTGYSKTIDSFIETICSTAQIAAGICKADQYYHSNQWKDLDCRSETFNYRAAASGIPVGPAALSTTARICRSVHGPLVARDDAAGLARSVQYAMYRHEIDTIEGVRQWNRAHSFAEFVEGVRKLSWNENTVVAARDGHIAYFHPGIFPARSADADMRLPSPGTGAYDFGAPLPFEALPQVVDPPQGYLANWNNKPAYGWLDGEGLGATSRPGGPGQRVTTILDQLPTRRDWTYADLAAIDTRDGTTDHRAREYRPVLRAFREAQAAQLDDVRKAALDLVLAWDASHYGPGIDLADASAHDGPAATIFGTLVIAVRDQLFAPLRNDILDSGTPDPDPNNPDPAAGLTIYGRESGVGSHVYDMSAMDNLALRVLNPSSSGLAVRHDWAGGRSRDAVLLAALDAALAQLASDYNNGTALTVADLSKCRRVHPRSQLCSLSGVIGPGSSTVPGTSCVTMPYEDRGSWVHRVGFERP